MHTISNTEDGENRKEQLAQCRYPETALFTAAWPAFHSLLLVFDATDKQQLVHVLIKTQAH